MLLAVPPPDSTIWVKRKKQIFVSQLRVGTSISDILTPRLICREMVWSRLLKVVLDCWFVLVCLLVVGWLG